MVLFFFFLLISSLNRALFSQLFHTGSRGRGGGVLVGKGNAFLQKCCAPALSNNFASDRRLALPCLIGKQRLLWLADVIYLSFFDRFTSWTLFWQSKTFFFLFGVYFKALALPSWTWTKKVKWDIFYYVKVEDITAYSVQISLFVEDHDPQESSLDV